MAQKRSLDVNEIAFRIVRASTEEARQPDARGASQDREAPADPSAKLTPEQRSDLAAAAAK